MAVANPVSPNQIGFSFFTDVNPAATDTAPSSNASNSIITELARGNNKESSAEHGRKKSNQVFLCLGYPVPFLTLYTAETDAIDRTRRNASKPSRFSNKNNLILLLLVLTKSASKLL